MGYRRRTEAPGTARASQGPLASLRAQRARGLGEEVTPCPPSSPSFLSACGPPFSLPSTYRGDLNEFFKISDKKPGFLLVCFLKISPAFCPALGAEPQAVGVEQMGDIRRVHPPQSQPPCAVQAAHRICPQG